MIQFFVGVALYLVLFNALMFVDSILIKRLTTEYYAAHLGTLSSALATAVPWAAPAAGYHADPSVLADVQNGYYAAVQNLARLSYQAIIAATFVVFPLVSRSTFTDDRETTRRYVEVTTRYSLIFAMAIAVVMAANPDDMLGLVYAADYAHLGGPALGALALGNVAFSMFAIAGTILNGAGKTRPAIDHRRGHARARDGRQLHRDPDRRGARRRAARRRAGDQRRDARRRDRCRAWVLHRQLGAFLPVASVVRIAIATGAALAVGRRSGRHPPLHGRLMTWSTRWWSARRSSSCWSSRASSESVISRPSRRCARKRAPGGEAVTRPRTRHASFADHGPRCSAARRLSCTARTICPSRSGSSTTASGGSGSRVAATSIPPPAARAVRRRHGRARATTEDHRLRHRQGRPARRARGPRPGQAAAGTRRPRARFTRPTRSRPGSATARSG